MADEMFLDFVDSCLDLVCDTDAEKVEMLKKIADDATTEIARLTLNNQRLEKKNEELKKKITEMEKEFTELKGKTKTCADYGINGCSGCAKQDQLDAAENKLSRIRVLFNRFSDELQG